MAITYDWTIPTCEHDITGESAEVQAICAAVHTQAVKDAYAAHLASQEV